MAVEKKETGKTVETKAPAAKTAPVAKAEAPKAAAPVAKAAAPKAAVEKKPEAKKETIKKDTVKKTEAPKKETVKKAPAASKPAAEKAAPAVNVVIQFAGKSVPAKDILATATKAFTESHKGTAIKSIDIYVKPEDSAAYYVVNGEGSDEFKVEL